jgi:poly(A) polymerase
VIDHVGGLADLRAGVVRAVGDPAARLSEDHLRGLRGVRFAARLGFAIEPATRAAIAGDASALRGVSAERVGEELRRMLGHPSRAAAVRLLRELGLESAVLGPWSGPGLRRVEGLPGDASAVTSMAAWALDRGTDGRQFRAALTLSNQEIEAVLGTMEMVARLERDWSGAGEAARKRMASGPWFEAGLLLLRTVDAARADALLSAVRWLEARHGGLRPMALVTGGDLIEAGLRPGPMFGLLLDRIYDAQLEGRVTTVAEGLALGQKLWESGGWVEHDRSE